MADHHDHAHHTNNQRLLLLCFGIITLFMGVEYVTGYIFNSLALMADAGHMANDSFSLILAWIALHFHHKPKVEKSLTLLNGFSLIIIAIYIIFEAIERLQSPQPMQPQAIITVATLGLIINLIVAKLMFQADHDNLNIKAAYLHVLADLMGSVVAIIAGLSAMWLDWLWVDMVASLALSLFILRSGGQILYQTLQHQH